MKTLKCLMLVGDPAIAQHVVAAGLDRLFVDLERLGKAARQGHRDTWMSPHRAEDISRLADACPGAELLVRVNPWHDGTAAEVADALARGATHLMLPMWREAETVARFADLVAGRARLMPLAETAGAVAALPALAGTVDEVLIGLNDLHLDRGLRFMFEPFADGSLEEASGALCAAGTPFGIGGIARVGEGRLPAERILGEHVRLGSEWVILSRSFHRGAASVAALEAEMDFRAELAALRAAYAAHRDGPAAALEANRREAAQAIQAIAADLAEKG